MVMAELPEFLKTTGMDLDEPTATVPKATEQGEHSNCDDATADVAVPRHIIKRAQNHEWVPLPTEGRGRYCIASPVFRENAQS